MKSVEKSILCFKYYFMGKDKARQQLEIQLINLIEKAQAHLTLERAVTGVKSENVGKKVDGLPYTLWQLVSHLRRTQADILEFSSNTNYKALQWPEDYWPKDAAPGSITEWSQCIKAIKEDQEAFIQLLKETEDLFAPFPHGDGQNMVREAMLIADHNAYHVGQIIVIRRLLGGFS